MAFFTPFNFVVLCQFYSNTSPVLFTKLQWEIIEWKKRRFFADMAASAYYVISREVKNHISRHNWIFRHTCYINNPHCQSSGIIIFMSKYYIVISVTLAGPFLDVLFLLFAVILSGLHEKTRRNIDWVTEKKYREEFGWGDYFFDYTSSFLCHILLVSSSTPSPFLSRGVVRRGKKGLKPLFKY